MNIQIPPGGILLSIGVDLVDVARIEGVLERQGDRFVHRVYTAEEHAYCFGMKYPAKHLAARFAAKEAVSKAFTTGIGARFGWKSASVYHGPNHEPRVHLDEQGRELLEEIGGTHVLISLSHTDTAAVAVVAIIRAAATAVVVPPAVAVD